jgi:hypothetical protein
MSMNNLPFTGSIPALVRDVERRDTLLPAPENNDFQILMKWMLNFLCGGYIKMARSSSIQE